jgi:TorA maturation chaperone TorD
MHDRSSLAQWLSLLGQAFLKDDPRALVLPDDAPPESMSLLVDEIRRACEDPQQAEIEYWRLFANASGAPCPPWQSVWSAEEGETPRLMGAPHHQALEWFREYGFEPAAESEPADHIGLLLLFYARLLASGEDSGRLASFRDDHLRWAPRLLARISLEARHPLYRVLADTANAVLA